MTKEDEIYAPFIERASLRPGGEIFLKIYDAKLFVTACQNGDMAVLGIEAARIDSDNVFPYTDDIADYSPNTAMQWNEYRERCNRLALDFLERVLEEKGENVYVCFELLERDEYLDCLKQISSRS